MARNWIESIVGAAVLVVAIWFFAYSYQIRGGANGDGYTVSARFTSIGGVSTGTEVRISGIAVGEVAGLELDPETYLAVARLSIGGDTEIPTDSTVAIKTESLLGGQFLAIQPGAAEEMLEDGEEIQFTQPAISLEDLLGKFIFSSGDGAQ